MTKRAFTLLEVLLGVFVLSGLFLLTVAIYDEPNIDHYIFMNDYLTNKIRAINELETIELDYGLHFNQSGHINMGKTIYFGKHRVIVHLGNGYLTYE